MHNAYVNNKQPGQAPAATDSVSLSTVLLKLRPHSSQLNLSCLVKRVEQLRMPGLFWLGVYAVYGRRGLQICCALKNSKILLT
jgi:hypothetical protein